MKYVVLADGTRIDNCNDSTTSNSIFAVRSSYAAAGAVRDQFNAENASTIAVFDAETDTKILVGVSLALLPGANITETNGEYVCEIKTRIKTETEVLQDEIRELQDAILG